MKDMERDGDGKGNSNGRAFGDEINIGCATAASQKISANMKQIPLETPHTSLILSLSSSSIVLPRDQTGVAE
jgi:hypothetical protein